MLAILATLWRRTHAPADSRHALTREKPRTHRRSRRRDTTGGGEDSAVRLSGVTPMNAVRCGFVCLSLGVLLCFGYIVTRRAPERERPTGDYGERSDAVPETIRRRILAKELLVWDLASGRLSLFAAAALFRELDRIPPETKYSAAPDPDPPLRLSSPTEDERYCVVVISVTRSVLRVSQPDRAEIVTERLVAEFEAERRRSGTIRLPGPGSLETLRELLRRRVPDGR